MRRDKHAYETRDELLVTEKIEAVSAKHQYLPDFLMLRDTYVDQMPSMRVLSGKGICRFIRVFGL